MCLCIHYFVWHLTTFKNMFIIIKSVFYIKLRQSSQFLLLRLICRPNTCVVSQIYNRCLLQKNRGGGSVFPGRIQSDLDCLIANSRNKMFPSQNLVSFTLEVQNCSPKICAHLPRFISFSVPVSKKNLIIPLLFIVSILHRAVTVFALPKGKQRNCFLI